MRGRIKGGDMRGGGDKRGDMRGKDKGVKGEGYKGGW